MRIWDIPKSQLCNQHLLGEHRELHAIFTYLTTDKGGSYRKHPETLRWQDHIPALFLEHNDQVTEMVKRKMNHQSDLGIGITYRGKISRPQPITPLTIQIESIRSRCNKCTV